MSASHEQFIQGPLYVTAGYTLEQNLGIYIFMLKYLYCFFLWLLEFITKSRLLKPFQYFYVLKRIKNRVDSTPYRLAAVLL